MTNQGVKIYVLPGGKMPERKTKGAIGFDVFLRAVVSPTEMDPTNPILRKTVFDFETVPDNDPYLERRIIESPTESGKEFAYEMDAGESTLVGIGFVTEMEFPMFYWVAPRSGLASKYGITVTNAPGTVDPDYRGEAGVIVKNGNSHKFLLKKDMRIAQIVFQKAIIPSIEEVTEYGELASTIRGTGGFGSTGVR